MERDLDAELLSNTVEEVAGNPEVVTHLNTLAGANLELPLGRENLGVDTRDLDTSVQAGAVVSLNDVTAVDLAGTNTAVVRTLGARETTLGPAVGGAELVEKGVLLLKTEPRLMVLVGLHELVALMAVVELVRGSVTVPALVQDKDVVATAERIGKDSDRAEVDIGVATGGLTGRGTVEVPLGEIVGGLGDLGQSLRKGMSDYLVITASAVVMTKPPRCHPLALPGPITQPTAQPLQQKNVRNVPWSYSSHRWNHQSKCIRPESGLPGEGRGISATVSVDNVRI